MLSSKRLFTLFVLVTHVSISSLKAEGTPVTVMGETNIDFLNFDTKLTDFVNSKGFEACTAAISKDKKVVHRIGIGWNNREKTSPIDPNARMRIASVTKSITQIALYKLFNEKNNPPKNNKLWELLNRNYNTPNYNFSQKKIWNYTPQGMPEPKDQRVKDITVQQLIEHKSGWGDINALGFDPQFEVKMVSDALGLTGKPTTDDIIYYMLTNQSLQFNPGTTYSYSNFGYNVLGRVIEKVSGQNYIDYLRQNVFAPLGITSIEVAYSGITKANEIWYKQTGETYLVENMDSHGGLLSNAADLAKLFDYYWATGQPRKDQNYSYFMMGSIPTTMAAVYQEKNMTVAILFNDRRNQFEKDFNELLELIQKTLFKK